MAYSSSAAGNWREPWAMFGQARWTFDGAKGDRTRLIKILWLDLIGWCICWCVQICVTSAHNMKYCKYCKGPPKWRDATLNQGFVWEGVFNIRGKGFAIEFWALWFWFCFLRTPIRHSSRCFAVSASTPWRWRWGKEGNLFFHVFSACFLWMCMSVVSGDRSIFVTF